MTQNIPRGPIDDFIDKWITGGKLKNEVQKGIDEAQKRLEEGASQAVDTAKDAAKAEIQEQAQVQVQEAKTGIAGLVENIKILVQTKVEQIKNNIINFFSNFRFKSKADTI
jgi:DNA-binding ferritin-like protein